jgi:hypothetical protein
MSDLWWKESVNGTGISPRTSVFISVSLQQCSKLVVIYVLFLPEGQTGEAWEPSQKKQCPFESREALDIKLLPIFSSLKA